MDAAVRERETLELVIPVKTISEANQREHWGAKLRRKKAQQKLIKQYWQIVVRRRVIALPCTVRLVRIGPRRLDPDNLAGSFKHCQDAIAAVIGIDDGDERIKWEYAQEPAGKRVYQVRIEIQSVA